MDRYEARIDEAVVVARDASYETLVRTIAEYMLRGAIARAADRCTWEHERIRREGLHALEVFRNGRAIWCDELAFQSERPPAEDPRAREAFDRANELDTALCARLDSDLQSWWRRRGYDPGSLLTDARTLFSELERDAADRASDAREGFLQEILRG